MPLDRELHILKLLTEDVKLQVKNEEELGEENTIDTGVAQDNILFETTFHEIVQNHPEACSFDYFIGDTVRTTSFLYILVIIMMVHILQSSILLTFQVPVRNNEKAIISEDYEATKE